MAISVVIITANFPLGNPGSLGEPLGQVVGEAEVTGDASGGAVTVTFNPQNPTDTPTLDDQRREHVYFIDALDVVATSNPGNASIQAFSHGDRSNTALLSRHRYTTVVDFLDNGSGLFLPDRPIWPIERQRAPFFWQPQELAVGANQWVEFKFGVNTLNTTYLCRLIGRFYDRQILGNRGFGRLISPPSVSQFEG